jgi:hypothetical protein
MIYLKNRDTFEFFIYIPLKYLSVFYRLPTEGYTQGGKF